MHAMWHETAPRSWAEAVCPLKPCWPPQLRTGPTGRERADRQGVSPLDVPLGKLSHTAARLARHAVIRPCTCNPIRLCTVPAIPLRAQGCASRLASHAAQTRTAGHRGALVPSEPRHGCSQRGGPSLKPQLPPQCARAPPWRTHSLSIVVGPACAAAVSARPAEWVQAAPHTGTRAAARTRSRGACRVHLPCMAAADEVESQGHAAAPHVHGRAGPFEAGDLEHDPGAAPAGRMAGREPAGAAAQHMYELWNGDGRRVMQQSRPVAQVSSGVGRGASHRVLHATSNYA